MIYFVRAACLFYTQSCDGTPTLPPPPPGRAMTFDKYTKRKLNTSLTLDSRLRLRASSACNGSGSRSLIFSIMYDSNPDSFFDQKPKTLSLLGYFEFLTTTKKSRPGMYPNNSTGCKPDLLPRASSPHAECARWCGYYRPSRGGAAG